MSTYLDALYEAERLIEKCIAPEEVCAANELELLLKAAKRKLGRSHAAQAQIELDSEELFQIVCKGLPDVHGASTPKDVATAVVEEYLDGGMSLVRARKALHNVPLVLKIAQNTL